MSEEVRFSARVARCASLSARVGATRLAFGHASSDTALTEIVIQCF